MVPYYILIKSRVFWRHCQIILRHAGPVLPKNNIACNTTLVGEEVRHAEIPSAANNNNIKEIIIYSSASKAIDVHSNQEERW